MTSAKICFILFVSGVFLHHVANAFNIYNCAKADKSDARFESLKIDSCPDETAERCTFTKGQNATLHVDFTPLTTFTQANIGIWGKLGPIYIPFPLAGPKDACGNYGFDCPVQVDKQEALELSIPVLRSYPTLSLSVRFEMTDENKKQIVCVEFPVQLKSV